MPLLGAYQGKVPKIRWLSNADQYAGDSGGGAPPSGATCVAGATTALEDWTGYADETAMRLVWPVSQLCASGTQVGGYGGVDLAMTNLAFSCGIGSGGGYVYHRRTFSVANGFYRVSVPFALSSDPGFFNMGMQVNGTLITSGVDTTLVSCSTAAGGTGLTVDLGAFILEYGMAPITLTFGDLLIQEATLAEPAPGEGGQAPGGDGWCELHFGFPLDGARSWPAPSPTSETSESGSGFEDAWIDEEDEFLEGRVTHVPAVDVTRPMGLQTGWDSPCGWARFLEWARRGNTFEFWRDKDNAGSMITCYLDEPREKPELAGLHRNFTLRLRAASLTPFTGY